MSDRLFRRRDSKVWYCWVYDAQGKRTQRSTRCTDRRAAEAALREFERRAADPAYAAAHSTTLDEALRRFLVDRKVKGRAPGTLDSYRVKAGHLLRVLGAETRLAKVDARTVDRFIEQRLEEGASPNTLHKELTVLRGTLKVAKRRGEYTGDIDAVMPNDFSPQYEPRTRFLSNDEFRALVAELAPDRAARVAFIVATGARWSESERARLEDVDTKRGFVRLRGTKTKNAERVVPIVGDGADLIEYALRHAQGENGLVFRPWSSNRRDLETACARAKIAKVSPNDLRRTYGTWLRQASVEPNLIGAAMGHADSRMVERVYGRLPPDSLKLALQWRVEGRTGPMPKPSRIVESSSGSACSNCVAKALVA
jgi:integrase